MTPSGEAAVATAQATGSWAALDEVETLAEPDDLRAALDSRPTARGEWDAFPPSVRRAILEWLNGARRPETRTSVSRGSSTTPRRGGGRISGVSRRTAPFPSGPARRSVVDAGPSSTPPRETMRPRAPAFETGSSGTRETHSSDAPSLRALRWGCRRSRRIRSKNRPGATADPGTRTARVSATVLMCLGADMGELLWPQKPPPTSGPSSSVWTGSPETPIDLAVLRRRLRRAAAVGFMPLALTPTTSNGCCSRSRS